MDRDKLRQEFRTLRKGLGLSQQAVADKLECSVEKIRYMETGQVRNGKPYPITMESIYALRYLVQNQEET